MHQTRDVLDQDGALVFGSMEPLFGVDDAIGDEPK
jgi:hypothetical protein